MYYFCTSLDKDGHSPSQEELDAGINALRDFPGPRTYNIALWQPHLEDPKIVDDLYTWLEKHASLQFNFETLRYADKQIWFVLVPERKEFESDKRMKELLHRQHIVNQIKDPGYLFRGMSKGSNQSLYFLDCLARIFMSIHCLTNFMHKQYGYHTTMCRKVRYYPHEFNVAFGKYFCNLPVLPMCLTTFYSTPHIIKHHTTKREMISNDNGSITMFKPMAQNYNGEEKTYQNAHYWDKEQNKPGRSLTLEEKIDAFTTACFMGKPRSELLENQLKFDLDAELFPKYVFTNYTSHHQAKN